MEPGAPAGALQIATELAGRVFPTTIVRSVRILLATRAFPPDTVTGVATVMHELWERLREDHEVALVGGWRRDSSLLPRDALAVRVDSGSPLKSGVALDLALRRKALRFRPDVILAQGLEFPVHLAPTLGLLAAPFSGHERWGRAHGARNRMIRKRIASMAMPVAPSEAARDSLIRNGVPGDSLRVAYPGVDTGRFQPDKTAAVPPPPGEGPVRLLYAARVVPEKGQHVAVEAVNGLPPRLRRRVVLDLVGPVEDPDYFAALKRRAGSAPVHFHDQVPDLVPWYRQAHIVLFPSVADEVFGYSAVDGMACGKPVVYSRCGALPEVTQGIGIDVAPGDVKDLGQAIRKLVQEPELCRDLGRRGRELCLERYSWEVAATRYLALLEEAAGLG